ncbi:CASP-like protein 5A2 [Lycium barbarum]|uniref:CASP-like protein 5A2 n=1 Tax=Lycium barbarum TaxID=112863 RepID=UPI00293E9D13|nr:CASP-like protein 5A2 [Lycium barbarum]
MVLANLAISQNQTPDKFAQTDPKRSKLGGRKNNNNHVFRGIDQLIIVVVLASDQAHAYWKLCCFYGEFFHLIWFPSYLVAAAGLQSLWSLSLGILDVYALLVGRCLQNSRIVSLFVVGDGVTSTLTFAAACASAGITVLIGNDLGVCSQNHCLEFETATAMAFLSWFCALPSFLLNFWSLASR